MTIEEYFGKWSYVIDLKEADRIMKRLSVLKDSVCPMIKDVFKAFILCPPDSVRVVILGEDPYPQYKSINKDSVSLSVPVATGLAFANSSDTAEQNISKSLDILKESIIDYTVPHQGIIFDNSLEKWEAQGVLLLNAALTCEKGKSGSHLLLWRPFIRNFLSTFSNLYSGIVYVLMGSHAQSFECYINSNTNYIVKVRHPAYYTRTRTKMPSNIWREINKLLTGLNGYGIQWYETV